VEGRKIFQSRNGIPDHAEIYATEVKRRILRRRLRGWDKKEGKELYNRDAEKKRENGSVSAARLVVIPGELHGNEKNALEWRGILSVFYLKGDPFSMTGSRGGRIPIARGHP